MISDSLLICNIPQDSKIRIKIDDQGYPEHNDLWVREEIENKDKNMKEKEIKAKEHLEDMFEVTRNLSYSDIKMLKNDTSTRHKKSKNKNRNEIQREID